MANELRALRNGRTAELGLPAHAATPFVPPSGPRHPRRPEDLTPRELQILQLVWDGHTSRLIAEQLNISIKTAEAHRANMMKKLRASNTAQLMKAALEAGLVKASFTNANTGAVESVVQEMP